MVDGDFRNAHSDGKGRKLGAAIGFALAITGFGLVLRFWAHQSALNVDYGLQSGGKAFHMCGLVSGIFLASMGTMLMARASFGRWDWSRR